MVIRTVGALVALYMALKRVNEWALASMKEVCDIWLVDVSWYSRTNGSTAV